MSILGSGGLPALGLASSVAGAQQRPATSVDRAAAETALQKLKSDQTRLANQDLDDSVETEFSHGQVADRDPDGRLAWHAPGDGAEQPPDQPAEREPEDPERAKAARRAAQDGRGWILDVEA